jgi:hypothetical protein
MSVFGMVLLIWGGVLIVLVTALSVGTRRRRAPGVERADRRALPERRRPDGDRRRGLPDTRAQPLERRSAEVDRRSGVLDRRRTLGAM